MKAVLFDLDDTLYPEIEFVRSGFRAVASYLGHRYSLDKGELFHQLMKILERNGRGRVFDTLLGELGLCRSELVQLLVLLYRSHSPQIRLYDDVPPVLEELHRQGIRLGLVTDGMATMQRSKIAALHIAPWFEAIVCTDEMGRECSKPSPAPYQVALELLAAKPSEAAYVANDPRKDFAGARSLNILTVLVRRETLGGSCKDADLIVDCFANLVSVLLKGR
jgi:putative hydrolase of the HAD superfamily